MKNIFNSKLFLKLFSIPVISWVVLSLLFMMLNESKPNSLSIDDLVIGDSIFIIFWFIISIIICYIYEVNKESQVEDDYDEISTFKKIVFPFIMSIITFLIGLLFSIDLFRFQFPISTIIKVLLLSFSPFVIFLIIIFLIYKFKTKRKIVTIFDIITLSISITLPIYYITSIFLLAWITDTTKII